MTIKQNEKKAQTFATYTLTVSSHLTPDELIENFNPMLISRGALELENLSNDSTTFNMEEIELKAVEWIDEEKN